MRVGDVEAVDRRLITLNLILGYGVLDDVSVFCELRNFSKAVIPFAVLVRLHGAASSKLAIGTKHHELIVDRRQAIYRAVEMAEKDDIVVILGKGHENYQILKDKTIHFDDKEEARAAVAAKLAEKK